MTDILFRNIDEAIKEFEERIKTDGREFCEELFKHATVRLLAHKYAYYVCNSSFVPDITYDGEEKTWFVMGRALGLLKEDETSPCIDYDENHPAAAEGKALAERLMR